MHRQRVLIVEDDPQIGRLVATELGEAGYDVELIGDGAGALERFERDAFALIVLDLILPGLDGLEICRRIRAKNRFTPIVMMSARAAMSDVVRGLELGADDYVTKPFGKAELMARIQALFRRMAVDRERENEEHAGQVTLHGALAIDTYRHEVSVDDAPVALTAKEFDLLLLFVRHPGRTFSRGELLSRIWGVEFEGYEHTVNTHINRLRNKLGDESTRSRFVETVWGVGYRFRDPGD